MKRWAALTVLLYVVALCALSGPVLGIAFSKWWTSYRSIPFADAFKLYREWGYWIWLGVMGLGQALLLLLPVTIAERRPSRRRPLFVPVLTATFFLANLCAAGLFSLLWAIFRDDAFTVIEFFAKPMTLDIEHNALINQLVTVTGLAGLGNRDELTFLGGTLTIIACFWLPWTLVFLRFAKGADSESLLQRITRWLLRGSILELLVAVPSHVIVRRREDCCAPGGTFWGITMGLSVMLLCFGPGVFFLFAERFNRLQPKDPAGANHTASANSTRPKPD